MFNTVLLASRKVNGVYNYDANYKARPMDILEFSFLVNGRKVVKSKYLFVSGRFERLA
jgi:hypothetical protein